MNTEKTVSARTLQNRKLRREKEANSRACQTLARMFSADSDEVEYTYENGRKVRVTPASDQEIAYLLRDTRVLDAFDLWEGIGKEATSKLIQNGSLKRDASWSKYKTGNLYWITQRAAELYGIPATFKLAGGATVSLPA